MNKIPARVPAGPSVPGSTPAKSASRSRAKPKQHDDRGRDSRAQDTRNELFDRVDENQPYVKPASLEAPPPRPGYEQRWVRVGVDGKIDEKNLARKLRGGWRARESSSVPKGYHLPKMSTGRLAGAIVVEGMMLCEIPRKLAQKRRDAIRADTDAKTNAVNEQLLRVNEGAGGGFGPIRKGEKSQVVREVKPRQPAGDDDVDLSAP